ncbi:MAG TPA: asparagine synthase (glutamine-hydrolyzing) [Deltaproteobacteria bacterium]|nr:asparagine synthase (glutamine-hydrolyzing) [Deltaproteobacteria bacterium]
MCGIVTIVRKGTSDLAPDLERVMDRLSHRGPDDRGSFTTSFSSRGEPFAIGLGHVRLSIIDLSARGRQPMVDDDGAAITYNGEIYNYLELREELAGLGHTFHTHTDTEVILAAYRQWGEHCLDRLIGMWAFAIWDGASLFVSRDRLGKKPLYYHFNGSSGLLAFASELKAFKALPGVPWDPDGRTVYRYLSFAEVEKSGRTFFRDILEFPAASFLRHVPGERLAEPVRFWGLSHKTRDVGEAEAVRTATDLLQDSVRLRLRSDAPLGLSLSGGLDSTLLLALVNENGCARPPVFSSQYPEPGYNEKTYFREAAEGLGCVPFLAETSVHDFTRDFERLVYQLDQPSRLPGPFSLWQVAGLASGHVKVLIDGQGPDELAGGYLYHLPASVRDAPLGETLSQAPDILRTAWANRHLVNQYPLHLIWERITGRVGSRRGIPLRQSWAGQFAHEQPSWSAPTDLNATLARSVTEDSLPALLRYGDRVNMAFGMENRCPYLDHRLVEYITSLPRAMKIRGGTTKWIFRAVAKGRIPEKIRTRRLKLGFPTPVGEWFRDTLREDTVSRLIDYGRLPLFDEWIDTPAVLSALDDHAARRADHQALLWRILSMGAWVKVFDLS